MEQLDKNEQNQKETFAKLHKFTADFPKGIMPGQRFGLFSLKLEALNPSSNLPA